MEIQMNDLLPWLNTLILPVVYYIVRVEKRVNKIETFMGFLKDSCTITIRPKGDADAKT